MRARPWCSFASYKGIKYIGSGPHLNLITSLKSLSLNTVTVWGTGGLGFQHMNFCGTHFHQRGSSDKVYNMPSWFCLFISSPQKGPSQNSAGVVPKIYYAKKRIQMAQAMNYSEYYGMPPERVFLSLQTLPHLRSLLPPSAVLPNVCLQVGQIWKDMPTPELPVESADVFLLTVIFFYSLLCPVIYSSIHSGIFSENNS